MTRAGATVLVAALCAAVLATPAAARSARLLVTDMTRTVRADEPGDMRLQLLIENDGGGQLEGAGILVEVHDAVGSRSALHAALDDAAVPTPQLYARRVPVRPEGAVGPGDITGFSLTLRGDRVGWAGRPGVYPVRISLLADGRPLDQLVTAVVAVPGEPSGRLLTTVVWPLTGEPGGTHRDRLGRILRALEERPRARVLLAPAAHLLEEFARAGARRRGDDLIGRIRDVADELPLAPVATPYADVALPWLVGGGEGLARMAGTAVAEGRRRIAELSGRAATGATILVWDRLTPEALDVLSGSHLLAPYDQLRGPAVREGGATDLPPLLRTLRSASGRTLTMTAADPYVATTVSDPDVRHGVAPAVQRTLAETAMIFFEAPHRSGRPLLVLPPPEWHPPPGFASGLLGALTGARWLHLTPPEAAATGEPPPPAQLAAPGTQAPPELRRRLDHLRTRLEALAGAVTTDDPRVLRGLSDELMRAASHWFQTPSGQLLAARLDEVESTLEEQIGSVTIPVAAGITLTSDHGRIPVTLQREHGAPLRVQVSVESGAGLDWPRGRKLGPLTLRPGSSETVSFPVRALSQGRVPVTVTVTDPSGVLRLGRARLAVRSTTIGTPALAAVATVVVLLLGVGIARNRPRRRRLEVVE